MKADKVRDAEALKLIRMVDLAVRNYNLETGFDGDNISLNNEITLDTCGDKGNLVVYAVSKFSVITTAGERIKFLKLDRDDIYTLQDIIHDEYDIDYVTA
jgi:hypothetical protein